MNPSAPVRSSLTRALSCTALAVVLASSTLAGDVFSKPPSAGGGVNPSSWVSPDGSDSDMYAWDDFTLPTTQTITEVRWRGGYALGAPYGHLTDFRISFFDSVAGGFQPLVVAIPENESQEVVIATFHTGNDAGESYAGTFGGVAMYDYRFVLPHPITFTGGVKYWFRALAAQPVYPDWGMCSSPVGDGSYFRYSTGLAMFHNLTNNLSFSLVARWEDLGRGLAGTAGEPRLAGSGTLASGVSNTLALTSARASAPVVLALGLAAANRPLFGGVLVPVPLQRVHLVTSGAGLASWSFTLPPGFPGGTELFMQAWVRDAGAVQGWAASNALSGATP